MPLLVDEGLKAVDDTDNANTCAKVFQTVHSSNS